MKIFSISDLHLSTTCNKPMDIFGDVWQDYFEKIKTDWNEKVGKEDIVLIAGDISWAMDIKDAQSDIEEISKLKGKKVIIRGNHDYWWKSIGAVRNFLPDNMYALQNDAIKIENYIFCGSRGWQVPENEFASADDEKIFNREIIRMELSLKTAQNLKKENEHIIALIHYPPFNSKLQESAFTKLFEKYGVEKVIYGHIHGKNSRAVLNTKINGIQYFLTSCDKVENKLVEIYGI